MCFKIYDLNWIESVLSIISPKNMTHIFYGADIGSFYFSDYFLSTTEIVFKKSYQCMLEHCRFVSDLN